LAAALLSAAAFMYSAMAQPYEYAVFDLGYLEARFATALGINEDGAVVGIAGMFRNNHGYVWEAPGPMEDLGTLAGHDWYSAADAINDLGWVAGSSGESSIRDVPVLWRDGVPVNLSGSIVGTMGFANDLNNAGTVVGRWLKDIGGGEDVLLAFVWEDGVMTQLPSLIGGDAWSEASAINDAGDIVGWTEGEPYDVPVLWRDNEVIHLGRLPDGGNTGEARDINDLEQATGFIYDRRGFNHAFLWEDGVMSDIHGFGDESYAYAINNYGDVVGFNQPIWYIDVFTAFRWTEAEGMIELDTRLPPLCPYGVTSARDINDAGQIVGSATFNGSKYPDWAVILSPVHHSMSLRAAGGRLISGASNELIVRGATPGKRVYFAYAEQGGGTYIPGCTLQENALQLLNPVTLGYTLANGNGIARLRRSIPADAQGQTLLLQALTPGECAVSELIMMTIE